MAENSDKSEKSDSDSLDAYELYLNKLRIPENSDPEKIAANKMILNDIRQYPELWDETHPAFGIVQSMYLVRLLELRHNLNSGDIYSKWRKIKKYYEELIKMGKLQLSDDENPSSRNYSADYPYYNEMRFYNPIIRRMLTSASEKRRRSDDETAEGCKRDVESVPPFDQLGEESSSLSVSLETGPGSQQDTDSQDSSKLLSQQDTESLDSPQSKALLENLDRSTQTSTSSNLADDSEGAVLRDVIRLHRRLDRPRKKQLDKKLIKIVKEYMQRPSSSEDSSAP